MRFSRRITSWLVLISPEGDGEHRTAVPAFAGGGERAAVSCHDAPGNRQTQTQAAQALLAFVVALLEWCEDFFKQRRVDAAAGVRDRDAYSLTHVARTDGDPASGRCELDGVLDQVPEDLLQPRRIRSSSMATGSQLRHDVQFLGIAPAHAHVQRPANDFVEIATSQVQLELVVGAA